jgi:flagellar basal-body rod protein FlgC
MDAGMAIAASGMLAASENLTASASNTANMETTGPVPATSPLQAVPQTPESVYQAVTATTTSVPGGDVASSVSNTLPSYTLAYDPTAPFANLQGMVAAPNVDPVTEVTNQMSASMAFKANLAVFRVAEDNFKSLLDTLA